MSLRFVRRGDGVSYEFRREAERALGAASYRRLDMELFCRRLPDFG